MLNIQHSFNQPLNLLLTGIYLLYNNTGNVLFNFILTFFYSVIEYITIHKHLHIAVYYRYLVARKPYCHA